MSEVTRDFNFRTDFIFEFFDVKNKQFRLITLLLHFFLCNNNNNNNNNHDDDDDDKNHWHLHQIKRTSSLGC